VVVPEDPLFEIQYHELKERLFSKYRRELPSEFTKVAGGDSGEPQDGEAAQSSFTPASTVTEADENHDVKSLRRALDKRLFFLVRSKGRQYKDLFTVLPCSLSALSFLTTIVAHSIVLFCR
jgi:large subunit ribosomal protein L46